MNFPDIEHINLFIGLIPIIAILYASVGHGGASGYLALMALFGFAPQAMRPAALVLNLFVAAIAFFSFFSKGHFKKHLFLPFIVGSIPFAFIGGSMEIPSGLFKMILGVFLLLAIVRMIWKIEERDEYAELPWLQGVLIGSLIGFFSGLIGIGGGIILSPLIILFGWGSVKEAAAASAIFIWVNSASGLLGQINAGVTIPNWTFILVGVATIGGIIGGYLGSRKLSVSQLKYALAVVLLMASTKLFFTVG